VTRRQRLAVVLTGVVAATTLSALPLAEATEPTVNVPARQWTCIWVDLLKQGICLTGG
jgi:hypothetical protein